MKNIISWVVGLSTIAKVGLVIASVFAVGAVSAIVAPPTTDPTQVETINTEQTVQTQEVKAIIETRKVRETEAVPYKIVNQNDSSLDKGKSYVSQFGVDGVKTITFEVTFEDGVETSRKKVGEEITTQPVNEIVRVGTYIYTPPAPSASGSNCDPNYSGACVPIASDVDCAGGSGNGPAYVAGPVYVIGVDIYGLDRDGDRIGCE